MKKYGLIALLTAATLMTGCKSGLSAYGPVSSSADRGSVLTAKSLPYEITVMGSTLNVSSVDLYEERYTTNGHPYHFSTVLTIDRSGVSDNDLYWVLRSNAVDNTLSVTCDLTSDKNGVKYQEIPEVETYYDDNNIYYIFYDYYNEYQYPLSDASTDIWISAEQEDTYTSDGKEYNKTNSYSLYVNSQLSNIKAEIKDISDMPAQQYEKLCEGLKTRSDEYHQLLQNSN